MLVAPLLALLSSCVLSQPAIDGYHQTGSALHRVAAGEFLLGYPNEYGQLTERPLIGQTRVEGAYVIGAVSGYGIMSACGAGELLAKQITGQTLPAYATDFELSRYDRPEYLEQIKDWQDSGQL